MTRDKVIMRIKLDESIQEQLLQGNGLDDLKVQFFSEEGEGVEAGKVGKEKGVLTIGGQAVEFVLAQAAPDEQVECVKVNQAPRNRAPQPIHKLGEVNYKCLVQPSFAQGNMQRIRRKIEAVDNACQQHTVRVLDVDELEDALTPVPKAARMASPAAASLTKRTSSSHLPTIRSESRTKSVNSVGSRERQDAAKTAMSQARPLSSTSTSSSSSSSPVPSSPPKSVAPRLTEVSALPPPATNREPNPVLAHAAKQWRLAQEKRASKSKQSVQNAQAPERRCSSTPGDIEPLMEEFVEDNVPENEAGSSLSRLPDDIQKEVFRLSFPAYRAMKAMLISVQEEFQNLGALMEQLQNENKDKEAELVKQLIQERFDGLHEIYESVHKHCQERFSVLDSIQKGLQK